LTSILEVNSPSDPVKRYQLMELEDIAEEIKIFGGAVP